MNSKLWVRKALSSCLMVAILATYSMVAFATDRKATGELLISGGNGSVVTVDGQTAETGRTIFSGSTLSTSDATSAVLNLGTAGSVQLAPKSTAIFNFDGKNVSVNLSAGSLTILSSTNPVAVNGNAVAVGATVKADDDKDDDKDKGAAWWIFAIVLGGAAAVLIGVVANDNDFQVGGGTTVTSPTR